MKLEITLAFSYAYDVFADALLHVVAHHCALAYESLDPAISLPAPKGEGSARVRLSHFSRDRANISFYAKIPGGAESERIVRIVGKDGQLAARHATGSRGGTS